MHFVYNKQTGAFNKYFLRCFKKDYYFILPLAQNLGLTHLSRRFVGELVVKCA